MLTVTDRFFSLEREGIQPHFRYGYLAMISPLTLYTF